MPSPTTEAYLPAVPSASPAVPLDPTPYLPFARLVEALVDDAGAAVGAFLEEMAREAGEVPEVLAPPVILNACTGNLDACPSASPVQTCLPMFRILPCACPDPKVVPFGCGCLDCGRCAKVEAEARADRAAARFLKVDHGRPLVELVLTLPPKVRPAWALPARWLVLRAKVRRLIRRYWGRLSAGLEATHPCGDKDPSRFHPQFNFLFVPEFGPLVDVDALRRDWAEALGVVGPVDLHVSYVRIGDEAKVRHRCRYVLRSFPAWAHWTPNICWWGPRGVLPDFEEEPVVTCPKCGQPYVTLGAVIVVPDQVMLPPSVGPPQERRGCPFVMIHERHAGPLRVAAGEDLQPEVAEDPEALAVVAAAVARLREARAARAEAPLVVAAAVVEAAAVRAEEMAERGGVWAQPWTDPLLMDDVGRIIEERQRRRE